MESEIITEQKFVGNYFSSYRFKGAKAQIGYFLFFILLCSLIQWNGLAPFEGGLAANYDLAIGKMQWWRLVTSIFVHGDSGHLLSNLLFLTIFSYYNFSYFGKSVFPYSAIFFGVLTNIATLAGMNEMVYLVGASGVVYYLGGFWLVIYVFVERQKSIRQRIGRSLGVGLVLLGPGTFSPETSYMAHLWGFVFGIFFALVYFSLNKKRIRSYEKYKTEVFEGFGHSPSEFN